MPATPNIHAIFPNFCSGSAVSYTLISLVSSMSNDRYQTQAYVLGKAKDLDHKFVTPLLPNFLYGHTNRLVKDSCATLIWRFKRRFKRGDIVYFWLKNPVMLTRKLQADGMLVAREMINCTMLRRRRELRTAYEMLGLPDQSNISDTDIESERQELLAADIVFCPNEFVLDSVLAYGVSPARCIKTSYGWDPERIRRRPSSSKSEPSFALLFVGSGDVRKGLPWLLRAWDQAGVNGRLLLAGRIEPALRDSHSRILGRPDVIELGYVKDVATAYCQADAFCFPTWEEGGPLVTIEAMASGLPCIVTPMGAAGIIKGQDQGGLLVQAGDVDALAAGIRNLAQNADLRARLARAAIETSAAFTWESVGKKRLEALRELAWLSGAEP